MSTYTLNRNNPDVMNISGKPAIQAASPDGKSILLALIAFAKEESDKGTYLRYVPDSKAWTDVNGRIVLFNVAETETTSAEAIQLVKEFSKKTGYEPPVKTQVSEGGTLATDNGEPIAISTRAIEESSSDQDDVSAVNAEVIGVDHESKKVEQEPVVEKETVAKRAAKATKPATDSATESQQ
ncbi:hypothetical protein EAb13_CDS0055 [Acinetobacter phage EAb13]|nr:hypothetical protein EAb13_CDS0055 [Acinetobacter phage EAb13]